jgi:hypothetical protein
MLKTFAWVTTFIPLTLWAGSADHPMGAGGVTIGMTKAELVRAIPDAHCVPPVQDIESCEAMLAGVPLPSEKGHVIFLLDRGKVEKIVVKIPAPIHSQVISKLLAVLGEPMRRSADGGSPGGKVSLLWRAGRDTVTTSDRPGDRGFGAYVISR